METQNKSDALLQLSKHFIQSKRRLNLKPYEKRYMFHATSPFTCVEGLRFAMVTNSPYDYLDYETTSQHLFLDEPTLDALERYIDMMFNEGDDFSYFKILKQLSRQDFDEFSSIVHRGKYKRSSGEEKVPICLIPVIEYQLLEDYSSMYTARSTTRPLDRAQIRVRLNTYFMSLMKLLQCSETEIVEVLHRKGVIPSRDFQLVSTQKEMLKSLKRFTSDKGVMERLGWLLLLTESAGVIVKPKYGELNTNLLQSVKILFSSHPLYMKFVNSLRVNTVFVNDGKGHLPNSERNKKINKAANTKDQSSLPRKLPGRKTGDPSSRKRKLDDVETDLSPPTKIVCDNILHQAMLECIPEYFVYPENGFVTVSIDENLLQDGLVLCLTDERVTNDKQ